MLETPPCNNVLHLKKKALIIRFSSIGDIILTTPVIRSINNTGDYDITYLTHERFSKVLASNPCINQIKSYDGHFWKVVNWIRAENFDVIIDLHCSIRSHLLRLTSFQKFYGFQKLRWKRWWRTKTKRYLTPDRHIALRFLDVLKRVNIDLDEPKLEFFISKENEYPITKNTKYYHDIALVPGARHFTKTLPIAKSETIVKAFENVRFHILGGNYERDTTNALNALPNVINYSGVTNLEQSADIIRQCDLVITSDTAMMHISAALGKKIISIWGGTVPEFGFNPFIRKNGEEAIIIENKGMTCRPCSKSGRPDCPLGHFNCMNKISTNLIESQIKQYLGANHLRKNDV